ncbi:MAG: hypothetical protein ABI855_08685 [Bacteroidota bacterium]
MKKIFLSFAFIFNFNFVNAQSSNTIWTFGPMFHFYFGKHFDFSMGLEAAMWKGGFIETSYGNYGYSLDFGLEVLNKKRLWVYSEFQTGKIIYGASIGPCLEIRDDSLSYMHLGMQGSCWANIFLGTDVRVRWMKDAFTVSPGAYLKIPIRGSKTNLGG